MVVGYSHFPLSLLEGLQPGERMIHSMSLRSDSVEHSFGCLKLGLQLRQLEGPSGANAAPPNSTEPEDVPILGLISYVKGFAMPAELTFMGN